MKYLLLLMFLAPANIADLMRETSAAGRVVTCAESPSERVSPPALLAPGAAPVLSFRNFDATERGRLSDMGLMMDDAGH